jgi:hypothetical protein
MAQEQERQHYKQQQEPKAIGTVTNCVTTLSCGRKNTDEALLTQTEENCGKIKSVK